MKALQGYQGETTDYSVHGLAKMEPPTMSDPPRSKAASELAGQIQETISTLQLVLERVAIAVTRGLDDSVGASSGGGEPVGGTRDFTQAMLDKLGGGGSMKIPDGRDEHGNPKTKEVPRPLERDDEARKHLATLVASVGAARDWSSRAKTETFRLVPLSLEKAKLLLGDGPSKCGNPNHDRDVWNTPQDRLRAGRCMECYQYWIRHDRTSERPFSLCHPEVVTTVTTDPKSATT